MAQARLRRRLATLLFLLVSASALLAASGPAGAQANDGPSSTEIHNTLRGMKRSLDQHQMSPSGLSAAMGQVTALRTQSTECQQASQSTLDRAQQAATAIGPPQPNESPDITRTRESIEAYKTKAMNSLAECRLDIVFADSLIAQIDQAQKNLLEEHLTQRGSSIWALGIETVVNPQVWMSAALNVIENGFSRWAAVHLAIVVVLAAAAGLFLGRWAARQLRERATRRPRETFAAELAQGVIGTFARYAAPWTASVTVTAILLARNSAGGTITFPTIVAIGIAGFLSAKILTLGLLAPFPPARQVTGLTDALAGLLARRLSVLAGTIAIGAVLLLSPLSDDLPSTAYDFARGIFVAILVINLAWLTWLVGHVPRLQQTGRALRLVLLGGLGVILAAEWLGYRNLSGYLLLGLMESLPIGAGLWLVNALVTETCAGLDGARAGWTGRVRQRMGLQAEEGFPGLIWLRLLLTAILWGGAALLLLRAWGLSDTGTAFVVGYLVDGVAIGDVRFIPSKVLTGIFIFVVLLGAARWLRDWVKTKWLSRSRMDRGAKDAVVTMTGYAGFVVAVLVALSAAGVNLANLAIIASALSVGIGFGLQNIVSNFVAGLILLFERPIKTGDWVVVGDTEGYVKRIGVRGTEIRTFERSDVTVPNSDLITGHVKNWTLRDSVGQAVVPISVAYGSDTELVRRLLLEIARVQPGIIDDPRHHPIKVLFRGFGESALNFELRFIVRNVEERSDVISDVNFAIDKAFREHAIEIPFPQQELRIRDWHGAAAVPLASGNSAPGARDDENGHGATWRTQHSRGA